MRRKVSLFALGLPFKTRILKLNTEELDHLAGGANDPFAEAEKFKAEMIEKYRSTLGDYSVPLQWSAEDFHEYDRLRRKGCKEDQLMKWLTYDYVAYHK